MPPARDSLELASLASSTHVSHRNSRASSSSSRAPSSRRLSFDDDPLNETSELNSHNRQERSYSVSSAFDFASNFYPLSSTAAGYAALGGTASTVDPTTALNGGSLERHKTLTYMNGLSLVIGLIIGSGIFSSPAQVNTNVGSPGASLVVWVVAGLLAWTGAASYAELGGAIPLNGGSQAYLSKIFGEWAGFMFTWTSVCVLKPGSAAIIAIIFGEYTVRAFVGAHATDISPWVNKAAALSALLMVTLLNSISTKVGMRSAEIFLLLKFVALLGVTITGIVVAATGFSSDGHPNTDWKTKGWFEGTTKDVSQWAVALYAGLWAFDGWDNVWKKTLNLFSASHTLN
jgi:amino acid permease